MTTAALAFRPIFSVFSRLSPTEIYDHILAWKNSGPFLQDSLIVYNKSTQKHNLVYLKYIYPMMYTIWDILVAATQGRPRNEFTLQTTAQRQAEKRNTLWPRPVFGI